MDYEYKFDYLSTDSKYNTGWPHLYNRLSVVKKIVYENDNVVLINPTIINWNNSTVPQSVRFQEIINTGSLLSTKKSK